MNINEYNGLNIAPFEKIDDIYLLRESTKGNGEDWVSLEEAQKEIENYIHELWDMQLIERLLTRFLYVGIRATHGYKERAWLSLFAQSVSVKSN